MYGILIGKLRDSNEHTHSPTGTGPWVAVCIIYGTIIRKGGPMKNVYYNDMKGPAYKKKKKILTKH